MLVNLFTKKEFDETKSGGKLTLKCQQCGKSFLMPKSQVRAFMKKSNKSIRHKGKFCSRTCKEKASITSVKCQCKQCNSFFDRRPGQLKKSKNYFCCQSCAATYNNHHKKHGSRRSKLEIWIENKLLQTYPKLQILFNDKTAINSELDIFIPSLSLAFELNGIFHYEPIYGVDKFNSIKSNDKRKFQACLEKGIELCLIDSSQMQHLTDKRAVKYLDIIRSIIDMKMCSRSDSNRHPLAEKGF